MALKSLKTDTLNTVGDVNGLVHIKQISGTGVASLSLDDAFSANFKTYRVVINITSASSIPTYTIRMRTTGSDNSTTNYNFYSRNSNSSTGSDTNSFNRTQSSATIQGVATTLHSYFIDIMNPFDTKVTLANFYGIGSVANLTFGGFSFSATTSFDGLSIIVSTGNIDATIICYGYKD